MFVFELILQQPVGLAPSAPKFALLSAEAAAKARPCGRDPGGEVFHPGHKGPPRVVWVWVYLWGTEGNIPPNRKGVKSSTQKYRCSRGGYC